MLSLGSRLLDPFVSLLLLLSYLGTLASPFPANFLHATLGAILASYIVGHSLRIAITRTQTFKRARHLGSVSFDVCLSILFMVISTSLLGVSRLLTETSLVLMLSLAITGSVAVGFLRQIHDVPKRPNISTIALVACVVVFGLSVASVFRRYFAWPSMPGWDVYAHLADSNWIANQGGLSTLFPSSNSTLLPYPYLFEALVASFSKVLGVSPYVIFWLGPYFSIPVYGVLTYGLTLTITRSDPQSLFSAVVATSISGGEILLGPQYFFTSTLFILFFVVSLVALSESPLRGIWQAVFGLLILGACFLLYYYPLFLSLPPLILIWLNRRRESIVNRRNLVLIILAFGVTASLTFAGSLLLPVSPVSFALKLTVLNGAYSDLLWFFIALGSVIVVVRFMQLSGRAFQIPVMMVCYVGLMIGLYLLPIPGSNRSELLLRPFASILASYAIVELIKFSTLEQGFWRTAKRSIRFSRRIVQGGVLAFLAISAVMLIQPYISYGQNVKGWSNISSDEYLAGQWLVANTPGRSYILTDPSSGFLLRGLTLLNSSTSFIENGEARAPNARSPLVSIIYQFFTTTNVSQVPIYFSELSQVPTFIVITTRTASWASWGGINSTFLAPTINLPNSFQGYQKFSSTWFVPVVSWQTVEIFKPSVLLLQEATKN